MNIDYLSKYDLVRFKQSGKYYRGHITNVVNNDFPFIEGKFYEIDHQGIRIDVKPFKGIIYAKSFDGLDAEWFFEGQGCDNSAIGCSGSWEAIA